MVSSFQAAMMVFFLGVIVLLAGILWHLAPAFGRAGGDNINTGPMVGFGLFLLMAPLLLYFEVGSPFFADQPFLADDDIAENVMPVPDADIMAGLDEAEIALRINAMVENLAARLEREGGTATEWGRLGRAYGVLGKAEEAARAYQRAAEKNPASLTLHLSSAQWSFQAGDNKAGVKALQHILEQNPEHSGALWLTGKIALSIDRPEEAAQYFERALKSIPRNTPLRLSLEKEMRALLTEKPGAREKKETLQ